MNAIFAAIFAAIGARAVTGWTVLGHRMRSLDQYCQGSTGQFAYAPDCHKFVNCGAGLAYLQECPAELVFDPFIGTCNWPRVPGKCQGFAYPPPLPPPPPQVWPIVTPPATGPVQPPNTINAESPDVTPKPTPRPTQRPIPRPTPRPIPRPTARPTIPATFPESPPVTEDSLMTPNPNSPSQPQPTTTEREEKLIEQAMLDLEGLLEEVQEVPRDFLRGPPYGKEEEGSQDYSDLDIRGDEDVARG